MSSETDNTLVNGPAGDRSRNTTYQTEESRALAEFAQYMREWQRSAVNYFPDPEAVAALEREISRLEQQYAEAVAKMPLKDALNDFIDSRNHKFFAHFAKRVQILMSRDFDPRNAELSKFDRLLIRVTENGTNLRSASAIYFYVLHYFGINLGEPDADHDQIDREVSLFYEMLSRKL